MSIKRNARKFSVYPGISFGSKLNRGMVYLSSVSTVMQVL